MIYSETFCSQAQLGPPCSTLQQTARSLYVSEPASGASALLPGSLRLHPPAKKVDSLEWKNARAHTRFRAALARWLDCGAEDVAADGGR